MGKPESSTLSHHDCVDETFLTRLLLRWWNNISHEDLCQCRASTNIVWKQWRPWRILLRLARRRLFKYSGVILNARLATLFRRNSFWEIVKNVVTPFPLKSKWITSSLSRFCSTLWVVTHSLSWCSASQSYTHLPYEYQWFSSTVDVEMLRIGNLVILIVRGKLTTPSNEGCPTSPRFKMLEIYV